MKEPWATIYICNGKWFDFTKKWYEKDKTWKSATGLERMQKNNRSDRKHGTFRKYGLPPIDTPEETSAIPFKKMKPKNEAYNIPRIGRSGSSIKQKPTTEEQTYGFCGENITIQAHSHYNCFRKKKIILPEKQKGIHSEKSKQTIEADCRFSGEISDYLYTALKGWGIWVSNRLPGK